MDHSVYLAQLLGPVFVILGLSFAFHLNSSEDMVKDFSKNKGLIYISVLLMLISGMAMILAHNVWEWSWRVIITVMGWAVFLKGVFYAFVPEGMMRLASRMLKFKSIFVVAIFIWLIGGLCLTYYGYFA